MANRIFFIFLTLFFTSPIKGQIKVSFLCTTIGKDPVIVGFYKDRPKCQLIKYEGNIFSIITHTNLIFINKNKFDLKDDFNLINKEYQNYNLGISIDATNIYLIKTSNRKYLIMIGAIPDVGGRMNDHPMVLIFDISDGIINSKKWRCIGEVNFNVQKFKDSDNDGYLDLIYKDESNITKKYHFK